MSAYLSRVYRAQATGRLVLSSVLLLVATTACGAAHSAPNLIGTKLPDRPAPAFAFRDQRGARISLGQLRGQVVALTFLYTHCETQCPIIAATLRSATQRLGSQSRGVEVVAISSDPLHDTPASARAFLRRYGLSTSRWHFLLGDPYHLTLIWSKYHVYAGSPDMTGQLAHTAGMYLIDQHGRERVYLDASSKPTAIVTDVRALLQES
jgi:protein SCO1/2